MLLGPAVVVSGTFTGTGQSNSFSPGAGMGFNITLYGTWSATVQLERSFDGKTWQIITSGGTQYYVYTGTGTQSFSEVAQDDERGVLYRLNCTAFTSGTVNYRLSQ